MNATQALATVLKLLVYIREDNCIDGIELPDTINMGRKDFDVIGDTIAQCLVELKTAEHPELGKLMQGILNLSKGKELDAEE
tara:strand:- start:2217 stop:2462 length:246 start_codon:yes stop_codon:yes gene_type:complete